MAKALRIVEEVLKRQSWTEAELKAQHKDDENHGAITRWVRAWTTMTLNQTVDTLTNGCWNGVSNLFGPQCKRMRKEENVKSESRPL